MDLQAGGRGAGGGGRRYSRGYHIPDVRRLLGIRVKEVPVTAGNPNSNVNTFTREEKLKLFFQLLRTCGVSIKEFQTVFESDIDQGQEINQLNVHAGGVLEEWAGMRREYYYLVLLLESNVKGEKLAQITGNMKSITKAIEYLDTEFSEISESIISRNGVPLPFPDVFGTDFDRSVSLKALKAKRARK